MNFGRITQLDLARAAGVHSTTVSLSFRNHPRIPLPTRKRIQALARKMGYVPDPQLQALISHRGRKMERKRPPTLVYLSDWPSSCAQNARALPLYYSGALRTASNRGFILKRVWMHKPGFSLIELNRELAQKDVVGLIVASHPAEATGPLELDWNEFPAVKIGFFPHRPVLHQVTLDLRETVSRVMQRLYSTGYRRIGVVMHRGWDKHADYAWISGVLGEQGCLDPADVVPLLYFPENNSVEGKIFEPDWEARVSLPAFKSWYERYRPEVIVSKGSFLQACFDELHLHIPDDVAFVDVFLEGKGSHVAGVRQNYPEVGRMAVEILADQLTKSKKGAPAIATTTLIKGVWQDGASCPTRERSQRSMKTEEETLLALQVTV